MIDSVRHNDWIFKAQEDLDTAEYLMEGDRSTSHIAFLCQQSAEKYLKAYILNHKKTLVTGHRLLALAKEAAKINPVFEEIKDACAILGEYYVETRYPSDIPVAIDIVEAKKLINLANEVGQLVMKYID